MFVNLHKNVNKCLFKHNYTPKLCTTLKWCIITVLALGEIYIFSKKKFIASNTGGEREREGCSQILLRQTVRQQNGFHL